MQNRFTRYKKKPFGIESWREYSKTWGNRSWYATSKAREQALADLQKKCNAVSLSVLFRKVER